ncbi:tripartite tricarboxylate transporter substrate binding protein [Cupriavidus sp. UYPR2.512]|uniref:Bug family tripartite tricarboxylate transporter substrate binding protein n=1 Tax=Cupriavidus sp. UYPR2.512 TaxID=1080187 RepID=UPI000374D038|nr:tripartite tricarboxylate transporter substrate binding protein [Cupriavidus sp. UYPR2.512]
MQSNDKRTPTAFGGKILVLIASALGLVASPLARADYPDRPIRLVLGFSAGGGTDVLARVIAQKMGDHLGKAVIVDNRPGANGNIAAELVAKAPADGYTLLYNTSSVILSPSLYAKLGYDPQKNLMPVGLAANQPIVLVSNPIAPVRNVNDVVTSLKSRPGQLNYGSAGNGNITHLSMLMFEDAIGAHGTHVPYRGEAPALADLVGGQVQIYMGTSAGVMPMVRDKRLRPLAVGSLKRLPSLPDVPTLDETVAKGLELGAWSGIMAPAGTPPEIVRKLSAALREALGEKDLQAGFNAQSAEVRYATPEQYGSFLKAEQARWAKLIRQANVKLE